MKLTLKYEIVKIGTIIILLAILFGGFTRFQYDTIDVQFHDTYFIISFMAFMTVFSPWVILLLYSIKDWPQNFKNLKTVAIIFISNCLTMVMTGLKIPNQLN